MSRPSLARRQILEMGESSNEVSTSQKASSKESLKTLEDVIIRLRFNDSLRQPKFRVNKKSLLFLKE